MTQTGSKSSILTAINKKVYNKLVGCSMGGREVGTKKMY